MAATCGPATSKDIRDSQPEVDSFSAMDLGELLYSVSPSERDDRRSLTRTWLTFPQVWVWLDVDREKYARDFACSRWNGTGVATYSVPRGFGRARPNPLADMVRPDHFCGGKPNPLWHQTTTEEAALMYSHEWLSVFGPVHRGHLLYLFDAGKADQFVPRQNGSNMHYALIHVGIEYPIELSAGSDCAALIWSALRWGFVGAQ